jgi:hypothetical protein
LAALADGQDYETIAEARHRRLNARLHDAGSSFAELQSRAKRHAGRLATQVRYSPSSFNATSEEAFGRGRPRISFSPKSSRNRTM